MNKKLSSAELIQHLQLEKHVEGGYYRRTYQAEKTLATPEGGRYLLTSIYYLLTQDSPMGQWHLNTSDIVHYFHIGCPIEYRLIHPDGKSEKIIMGSNLSAQPNQHLQLHVPGGVWKSSRLVLNNDDDYSYGLISEAVSPGFDFSDMTLGSAELMLKKFPHLSDFIQA